VAEYSRITGGGWRFGDDSTDQSRVGGDGWYFVVGTGGGGGFLVAWSRGSNIHLGQPMKKNVASQVIGAQMVSASDGSAFTGAVTAYVTGDGGTQAAGSVGAGACTHEGNGFHTYAPAQAETNYDHIAFTFIGTGAVPASVQVHTTFPQTGDNFARLGAPAGASVSADVAAVKAETAAIVADTNELQTDWVNGGRLDLILDARASQASVDDLPTNAELATALGTADDAILAVLGTPAGASLAADIAAIEAQTDDIGVAGAGLTAVPWNAAWDAEVQSEVADALVAYGAATGANVTAAAANVSVDEIQATALADLFNTDSGTTYASAVAGSVVKEIADNAGGSGLTEAGIADAVWDELIAGHAGVGSTGAALAAAGGSGDPWATALPGAYGAGTAGKIIGDNINATISSRATQTSVDDVPTNAELATALGTADDAVLAILGTPAGASLSADVAAVKAQTAAIETDTQDIQGRLPAALVSGRIDVSVGAMAANVMTAAAAAADLTTELQSGLATAAALTTVAGYIDTEVASILAAVDTEVGAIKAKTDNLPAAPAAVGDIPTATQNADALLNRDMAAVSDTNSRSPLNALRFIRNKWDNAAGTLSVKKEDDTTEAWTAVLSTDPAAEPITGVDPG
jgi:hypothetical protein